MTIKKAAKRAGAIIKWKGEEVAKRVREAEKKGINKTLSETVLHAKQNHDWQNRTGTLEGSIQITDFASETDQGVRGAWGSTDVRYALIHEVGGIIRPRTARALFFRVGGEMRQAQQVEIPARPYLRPAADAVYPNLARNIREALNR